MLPPTVMSAPITSLPLTSISSGSPARMPSQSPTVVTRLEILMRPSAVHCPMLPMIEMGLFSSTVITPPPSISVRVVLVLGKNGISSGSQRANVSNTAVEAHLSGIYDNVTVLCPETAEVNNAFCLHLRCQCP